MYILLFKYKWCLRMIFYSRFSIRDISNHYNKSKFFTYFFHKLTSRQSRIRIRALQGYEEDMMSRPRKQLISIDDTPYYHITSRCVRRSFLCGVDQHTGESYEHRRQWIVDRIRILIECLCQSIFAAMPL